MCLHLLRCKWFCVQAGLGLECLTPQPEVQLFTSVNVVDVKAILMADVTSFACYI